MAATTRPRDLPAATKHRATLPYAPRRALMPGEGDRTQTFWPWYLKPFHEPNVSEQCRAYVLGQYGASPAPISEEIRKTIAPDAEPITGRPADHLGPELEKAAQELGNLVRGEEDVVSYALFPQVVREFLEWQTKGGRLEAELVAAIAAALTHDQKPAQIEPAAAHGGDRSPWKLAGRQRLLRG